MLNGEDIASALDDGSLIVVPRPGPDALSGASVDLRLGRWFLYFRQTHTTAVQLAVTSSLSTNDAGKRPAGQSKGASDTIAAIDESDRATLALNRRMRQSFVPFGKPYVLHPGAFVLGATLEWLSLPKDCAAYVTGKSSLGRHGLVIETAAGIHPGFSGCLTLEIANIGEVPLQIYPGMHICQIFLHKTNPRKEAGDSRFSGCRRPTLGAPTTDDVLQQLIMGEHSGN